MDQYGHLKQRLVKEKEELEQRLEHNDYYQIHKSMKDSDGELSHYDNHPADVGSAQFERGKDLALLDHDLHHLAEIEEALQRLAEGTYGLCQVCQAQINLERLEAVPSTKYCLEHQPKATFKHARPVEEQVLTSFGQFNFDNDDHETEFDAEDSWQAVAMYNKLPLRYDEIVDPDEYDGYVEPIEGFIITDMDGNMVEESVDFVRNELYDQYLDKGEGYGMIWEEEIIYPDEKES